MPAVSVIIATYRRPQLAVRAVHSALAQTFEAFEVLVVVDGPDKTTTEALAAIVDARLRVIVSPTNVGQAAATNLALGETRTEWVAFLDDDDLWQPRKLEYQMALAKQSTHAYPIISCRLTARNEARDFVWPRRLPRPEQPLDEYLFCRHWPTTGEGMIQNSTILARTALFEAVPFKAGLKRFVDLDWLIRVKEVQGVAIEFARPAEPLAIWYIEASRGRVSNQDDWRWALAFIKTHRRVMTPRAYAAFILTLVSASAARQREWSAFFPLLREAAGRGRLGAVEVLNHIANFCLPQAAQAVGAGLAGARRRRGRA